MCYNSSMERLFDNSDFSRYRHCRALFVSGVVMPAAESEASLFRRSQYSALSGYLKTLFPGGVDCRADDPRTSFLRFRDAVAAGAQICYDAAFVAGSFCTAADVVKICDGGVELYYVKTTPKVTDSALAKAAYVAEVTDMSGFKVAKICVAVCNRSYVRKGKIDPARLLKITDVTERKEQGAEIVKEFIREAEKAVSEPVAIEMSVKCERPDKCEYFGKCVGGVARPCMLDFHGIDGKTSYKLFSEGVKSLDDLLDNAHLLKPAQAAMVRMYLTDDDLHIDKARVKAFVEKLHYPMCFLDFEACQPAVPLYDGTRPFMQIPFQYSLHVKRSPHEELEHYQYLPAAGEDPRAEIAKRLFMQIPHGASVVVFSKGLECSVLSSLATKYKEYAHKLNAARNSVADLQELFAARAVYSKAMLGSTSLKIVYPALFPGDGSCDYSQLDVHNGAEAMRLFVRAQFEPKEKRAAYYEKLYTYCGKDTVSLARMVQLFASVTGAEIGQKKRRRHRRGRRRSSGQNGTLDGAPQKDE